VLSVSEVLADKVAECLFSFCSVGTANLKINVVTRDLTALVTAKTDEFGSLLWIETERFK
jgi:hypothetical protein